MVVVVSDKNSHYITKPIPAPIENQTITFKNIDDKAPIEVIVSGSKNGNVGYAIYRVEGKNLLIYLAKIWTNVAKNKNNT